MIKRIVLSATLIAAFGTAHAVRVLEPVERPVELSLAALTLPTTTTGNISFRPCEQCPIATHLLTNRTEFFAGRRPVTYQEFLALSADVRQNAEASQAALVTVFLSVTNERVTRIALHRLQPTSN